MDASEGLELSRPDKGGVLAAVNFFSPNKLSHEHGNKTALRAAAVIFSGENLKAEIKPGFHPHSGSEGAVVMVFYFWKANQTTELKVTQWVLL